MLGLGDIQAFCLTDPGVRGGVCVPVGSNGAILHGGAQGRLPGGVTSPFKGLLAFVGWVHSRHRKVPGRKIISTKE